MLLHVCTLIAIISSLDSKPIVGRNVSDCSVTENGILHYYGQHSHTKFDDECLPWMDLQTVFPQVINEPNFFNDASIKAAKNYCRNPDMNVDGPWCFVQNEGVVTMEQCDVCQSLALKPTVSTNIEYVDEVTDANGSNGLFHNIRDEIKRYGAYIQDRFREIIDRLTRKFKHIGSRISDYFNAYSFDMI